MPRVLIVLGHPRGRASLCGALAEAYGAGAREAGAEVETLDLSQLDFAPDVTTEDPRDQPLEPDLEAAIGRIEAADHLVFVHPNWWGTYPALLKGFLDRAMLPGFAFRTTTGGIGYEGLLRGKTAELIVTSDTPALVTCLIHGAPGRRAMASATLGFCGIETTRATRFGVVDGSTAERRAEWIARARALGASLQRGPRTPFGAARRHARIWLKALRLQFYPMTFLAYWLGALLAVRPGEVALAPFLAGYAAVFLIEAATVFINDREDRQSDLANEHYGPFSGGSRVIADGELTPEALGRGAAVALGLAMLALGVAVAAGAPPVSLAVAALFLALALGYTLQPLKLSYRMLGEADVALTHSLGVLIFGFLVQGGPPGASEPYLLALPLGLSILPSIILANLPDMAADAGTGKMTLAVRLGARGAMLAAGGTAVVAAAAGVWLASGALAGVLAGIGLVAPAHAALLLWRIAADWPQEEGPRRIDGLMVVALTYMLWFVALPLWHLA